MKKIDAILLAVVVLIFTWLHNEQISRLETKVAKLQTHFEEIKAIWESEQPIVIAGFEDDDGTVLTIGKIFELRDKVEELEVKISLLHLIIKEVFYAKIGNHFNMSSDSEEIDDGKD